MPQTFRTEGRLGTAGDLLASGGGALTLLDISAQTLVKALRGRICRVSVIVAGSTPGSVNDAASVGGIATGNMLMVIPNTVGTIAADLPVTAGIVVTPGAGQVLSVSYL